jgi:hypothetical protein
MKKDIAGARVVEETGGGHVEVLIIVSERFSADDGPCADI